MIPLNLEEEHITHKMGYYRFGVAILIGIAILKFHF